MIKYKIIIRLLNLISNKEAIRRKLYSKMAAVYKARSAAYQIDNQPSNVSTFLKNTNTS